MSSIDIYGLFIVESKLSGKNKNKLVSVRCSFVWFLSLKIFFFEIKTVKFKSIDYPNRLSNYGKSCKDLSGLSGFDSTISLFSVIFRGDVRHLP